MENRQNPGDDTQVLLDRIAELEAQLAPAKSVTPASAGAGRSYRQIVGMSPDAVFVHVGGNVVFVNQAMVELMGADSADQLIGMTALSIMHPDQHGRIRSIRDEINRTNKPVGLLELRYVALGGNVVDVEAAAAPIQWRGEDAFSIVARNLTKRKKAEEALRYSEERFRSVFQGSGIAAWITDENGVFIEVNNAVCDLLGYSESELLGKTTLDITHPEDLESTRQRVGNVVGGQNSIYTTEKRFRRKDGADVRALSNVAVINKPDGSLRNVVVSLQNITDRHQAELKLRESEERFRAIFDNSPFPIFLKDLDGRFQIVNKRYEEWYQRSQDEVAGTTLFDRFPPEKADTWSDADRSAIETGATVKLEFLANVPPPDGPERLLSVTKFPVKDPDDQTIGVGTIQVDLTDQRRTEDHLRQVQKMEAVGQLTGGIAHDFNNLLAVIQGNAQLLSPNMTPEQTSHTQAILRATARGAELTQRLLAYSRRQPLHAAPVDLGMLATGMREMLTRTLGATIEVFISSPDNLWPALADQGQVESALLNLAINARDAMPEGGKLTVDCTNASLTEADVAKFQELDAGNYVVLAVGDTGTGMSPGVVAQAFEPFFTTKEVGKGSGLGLSMVYGFAKQSGGHVTIDSREGRGTTVSIYMPKSDDTTSHEAEGKNPAAPRSAGETILLIEDDPDVRDLAVTILQGLGYRVHAAADAVMVRKMLNDELHLDLVLSDVVLPGGTNGPKIVAEVKKAHPEIRSIFMSGYPAEDINQNPLFDEGTTLIGKPFSVQQLAAAVRQALA